MKRVSALFLALALLAIPATSVFASGFDEFGYNYQARVFVGAADGIDRVLNGAVWGDPTYANDHLVMKWNAAWDACNDIGNDDASVCAGAWTTNEWNGMGADGSKESWHYKFIWVGSSGATGPYWLDGGYSIWGNYEVIQSFGNDASGHYLDARARPAGLGASK